MGLAASQSRLLLLTARKNAVEAQMMTISNEKLMLSRKVADASKAYNNALNTKVLTVLKGRHCLLYFVLAVSNI